MCLPLNNVGIEVSYEHIFFHAVMLLKLKLIFKEFYRFTKMLTS